MPRLDPRMRQRAAELRASATHPEQRLWSLLRKSRLGGLKFRRQYVIGDFIADFCCPQRKVVVEVDGETHVGRGEDDARRSAFLESRGFRVIRVTNDDVIRDPDAVAECSARGGWGG